MGLLFTPPLIFNFYSSSNVIFYALVVFYYIDNIIHMTKLEPIRIVKKYLFL